MIKKLKVCVIFGGQSSEHEVSRVSAESVIKNINLDKYDVALIGITKEGKWYRYQGPVDQLSDGQWQAFAEADQKKNESIVKNTDNTFNSIISEFTENGIDVIFPVLHGTNGEDGTIQGLFELAGIPYVGSGVLGSALSMDKGFAKIIFEKEGIPQADYIVTTRKEIDNNLDETIRRCEDKFTYPFFVKPSNAGSSVGVSKAHDKEELEKALKFAATYDRRILVEEFINGREIECAVLGNDNPIGSAVGEVVASNEFYDYQAKYIDNKSDTVIPANIPIETAELIRDYAVRAYKALDCAGLSRVDFFVHKISGDVYINEINTLPGFTSISMYPKLWEASGMSYTELIDKLLELAIERFYDSKKELK